MQPAMSVSTRRAARATVDVYERHSATRELMETWLSQAGYNVRDRGGSRAPVDSPVDLVILATQVSTRQTLQLVRTMRVIYPTTAFLVLSGHPGGGCSTADGGTQAVDGTRVLSKPLSREQLLEAVQALAGVVGCNVGSARGASITSAGRDGFR